MNLYIGISQRILANQCVDCTQKNPERWEKYSISDLGNIFLLHPFALHHLLFLSVLIFHGWFSVHIGIVRYCYCRLLSVIVFIVYNLGFISCVDFIFIWIVYNMHIKRPMYQKSSTNNTEIIFFVFFLSEYKARIRSNISPRRKKETISSNNNKNKAMCTYMRINGCIGAKCSRLHQFSSVSFCV